MKALAVFLIVLCLAAFGGVWYLHNTSNVTAYTERGECVVTQLNYDEFSRLKEQLEQGIFTGIRFADDDLSVASEYVLYTWTIWVNNRTSMDARIAEVQVTPLRGDILQFDPDMFFSGSYTEHSVEAWKSGYIKICVLHRLDGNQMKSDVDNSAVLYAETRPEKHNAKITWYLGGFPFPETNGKGGSVDLYP